MGEPKSKSQKAEQDMRYQRRINVAFFIILVFLTIGVWRIPTLIKIHTAPDITKSFMQRNGQIDSQTVYGFARTIWEAINYCEHDCGQEYLQAIDKYSSYITKNCQHDLRSHFDTTRNLYTYRSRQLLPTEKVIFSTDNIKQQSSDLWYVKLEYNLKDEVNGVIIRDNMMLYPLKVIRSNKPLKVNDQSLEIDCYFNEGPVVLEARPVKPAN